jgi:hypothetical protein
MASGERRAVGQQPGAFFLGDKRQVMGSAHETDDARMRFGAEAQNCRNASGTCGSTDASHRIRKEQKRRSGIVEAGKTRMRFPVLSESADADFRKSTKAGLQP